MRQSRLHTELSLGTKGLQVWLVVDGADHVFGGLVGLGNGEQRGALLCRRMVLTLATVAARVALANS